MIVREGGAKTVAALCVTARSAWQHPPTIEMPARIELVPARSPYGTVIALYVALRDNPANPYRGETFLNPAEAPVPATTRRNWARTCCCNWPARIIPT